MALGLHRRLPALVAGALCVVGIAACGTGPVRHPAKPAVIAAAKPTGAKPDTSNPSQSLISCLAEHKVAAHVSGPGDVAVDPPQAGVHVTFMGTDGQAQSAQLRGDAEGAEVILNALLYVGHGDDTLLKTVETCVGTVAK